jgi:hypothetical protein
VNENNKYNILWELITAQNGAGLSDTPETPMTDTPHKNPESCTVSDTPEMDAEKFYSDHHGYCVVLVEHAEDLERERDEAIRSCHIWQRGHSKLVVDRDDWKRFAVEQEKEIEEWKVEVERWRSLAQGWREEAVNAIKDTRG